jgi:hypothetical protein
MSHDRGHPMSAHDRGHPRHTTGATPCRTLFRTLSQVICRTQLARRGCSAVRYEHAMTHPRTARQPGPPCPPRGTGFPTCLRCEPNQKPPSTGTKTSVTGAPPPGPDKFSNLSHVAADLCVRPLDIRRPQTVARGHERRGGEDDRLPVARVDSNPHYGRNVELVPREKRDALLGVSTEASLWIASCAGRRPTEVNLFSR